MMISKNIAWKYLLSRRWTILRSELFTKGYVKPLEEYVGVPNRDLLVVKELEKYSLYNSLDSLKEISSALVAKLKERKDFGKQVCEDCIASCENLVNVSKKVSSGQLNSLKIADLTKRLDQYIEAAYYFTPFLALPNNYGIYITSKVKEFLLSKVGKRMSKSIFKN